MSRIVIITNKIDRHVPYVARHLKEAPVLIDPMEVINGTSFSYRIGRQEEFRYMGEPLNDVGAVWLRKPGFFEPKDLLHLMEDDPVQLRYACSGLNQFTLSLMNAFDDAYWISARHHNLMLAENKPRQLRVARRLGFTVPETLITPGPEEAMEFVESRARCVAKPMSIWSPPGRVQYTSVVPKGQPLSFYRNLLVDPMIIQEAIDREFELRVSVVEDEVFAAKVRGRASSRKDILDYRQSLIDETFFAQPFQMDPQIEDLCVQYLREQEVHFGAFDFIVDREGVYNFLECNANGQWAFIEEETGQPIGKAIARRLQAACA